MNERVTDRQIVDRLQENDLPYVVLELQNGVRVLISERGGRVLGPFLQPGGESLFWVHPDFRQADAFRGLLASDWNLGGERWWVAPEIQYLCRDRYDYWNSEYIQPAMDPGQWKLERIAPDHYRLRQEMTLEVFNLGSGHKRLAMEVQVRPVPDPLRMLGAYTRLTEGVVYAGYEQVVTLSETDQDDILSGAWNIIPLYPGGEMILPASPSVEVTDYMEAVDQAHQTVEDTCVRLQITGRCRYLTGYKAAHVFGRLAYHCHLDERQDVLMVRGFFSDPSSAYLDEPPKVPGWRGDSVRVYNDDGAYGGYGEMEVYGRAIGGDTGRATSTDSMTLWLYVGPPSRLSAIATHLLGVGWD